MRDEVIPQIETGRTSFDHAQVMTAFDKGAKVEADWNGDRQDRNLTSARKDTGLESPLDARLDAQRRLLQWLLVRSVQNRETYIALLDSLGQPEMPVDFQEDPGAVVDEAFGAMALFNREMRLLLRPIVEAAREAGWTSGTHGSLLETGEENTPER